MSMNKQNKGTGDWVSINAVSARPILTPTEGSGYIQESLFKTLKSLNVFSENQCHAGMQVLM